MRPQPEGRGEPARKVHVGLQAHASMRPRPEGRGERRDRSEVPLERLCFNAATTRRPWRTPSPSTVLASFKVRFNAATARRPWRTMEARGRGRLRATASMRPRPEGRGEQGSNRGAPAATRRLQWGHGQKAVENDSRGGGPAADELASMRPRPEGRGEPRCSGPPSPTPACFNAATTRRPWRTRRFLNATKGTSGCFNAATTRRPWRTPPYLARSAWDDGFNAATTRRPWRTPAGSGSARCAARGLQCGHDPKAVENCGSLALFRRRTHPSFNAATTRRPWRTPGLPESDRPGNAPSFNAATTRRPWRTRSPRCGATGPAPLQCGHDPKAVENGACPPTTTGATPASMRPRPEGRGEPPEKKPPPVGVDVLQCGHDPKAVENSAGSRR